jgi:hypothetical protein
MISLSGRVSRRASGPSQTRVDDGGGLQYFSWIYVRALRVFLMKWIYRRKGDVRGRLGPTPGPGAARGGAAPPYGVAASWLVFVSPLDSVFVSDK